VGHSVLELQLLEFRKLLLRAAPTPFPPSYSCRWRDCDCGLMNTQDKYFTVKYFSGSEKFLPYNIILYPYSMVFTKKMKTALHMMSPKPCYQRPIRASKLGYYFLERVPNTWSTKIFWNSRLATLRLFPFFNSRRRLLYDGECRA